MIQLIISLVVGLALAVSLYFFARRVKPSAEGSAQQLREARQTLDSLQFALLPNDLVERIFAREDLEYVLSAAPPDVQSLFLKDRKNIALACRLLQIALYLRGPYAAPGMVRTAAAAAGRVCLISENSLAFLNVKGIDPAENDSARHRASV